MKKRFKFVGIFFILSGLVLVAIGGAVFMRAQDGLRSLDAVYQAQGIKLAYNDKGELTDRGTTEGAKAILSLLEGDWQYPLNRNNLNSTDPLINTSDELMVQFATISYHTLNGEYKVTLDKDIEYKGETFKAGEYTVPVDGRYWAEFDRLHPLDGKVRELAWSPTAHGLLGEISAGVSADYLAHFAYFIGLLVGGLGIVFALGGALVIWAVKE